ncbi:I66 family serine proteinase inhibitor [Streptomyces sp. NRRL F-5727]|uniref:I66 family serine proteinase inhibitor n=1 Tax=Streptomyces sp. NRRL F-5727 TaxID=1463871 RepID=UPI0004CA8DD7|nr:I66 family serine proteinase inhibitor [Streptomyces sp. NRRL F-5727]
MSEQDRIVRLYAKGAPVGVHEGRLVGFLVDEHRTAEWAVGEADGGFRLTVKGTEDTLTAAGTDRAPVLVRPDDTPASVWRLQRVTPEGVATVTTLDALGTGTYVITQHGLPLGRDLFEDRSLAPKPVVTRTDDRAPHWTVEVLA